MPKGPKGEKRPADVIGAAVHVMRVATGQERDTVKEKDAAAVALGRRGGAKGGNARAAALTPEQRRDIAQKAAKRRWGKESGETD